MRVLFLTNKSKPLDGASNVGFYLIKHLPNVEFDVFSTDDSRWVFSKTSMKAGIVKTFFYHRLLFDLICVLLFKTGKYDLIHANIEHYAPLAWLLSKIFKIPYIVTANGTYAIKLPYRYKLFKYAFSKADLVLSISRYTAKRMIEEKIYCNCKIINLGVDRELYYEAETEQKRKNNIVFVGNLKSRKGIDFVLKSFKLVAPEIPDLKLQIVGSIDTNNSKYKQITTDIENNKLNIEFLGWVSEDTLRNLYQVAKLNVLPSKSDRFYFEGFGLIHLEANACGTLTVGCNNSGNEDAIKGENGFLINFDDTSALCEIIKNVMSMQEYPKINNALISGWDDVAKEVHTIYTGLIK